MHVEVRGNLTCRSSPSTVFEQALLFSITALMELADLLVQRFSVHLVIGALELQMCPTLSGFYRGFRTLNSSLHARKARILPMEPSPQPLWILSLTAKCGWVGRS